jgi:amino acid transporter
MIHPAPGYPKDMSDYDPARHAASSDPDTTSSGGATTPQRRSRDREDRLEQARRDEFGGINWGSAFFGWLVAIALTVLLTGIVGAIAAAVGSENDFTQYQAERSAGTIGIVTAITLLVILMIGYFAGGYVAGRMSRFDGGRQGVAVWVIGLVITIIVAVIGLIAGDQYDIFARVNLPSVPIPTDEASTGGLITLIAVILATLLAAFLGGKTGQRYHRKVDRVTP